MLNKWCKHGLCLRLVNAYARLVIRKAQDWASFEGSFVVEKSVVSRTLVLGLYRSSLLGLSTFAYDSVSEKLPSHLRSET